MFPLHVVLVGGSAYRLLQYPKGQNLILHNFLQPWDKHIIVRKSLELLG